MIRRRQREFATYILLGAEQKNVALMFFIETIVIGVFAIITGIFIGTLFSQAITALVLISAKQEVIFKLRLYMDTVVITFIFFISMFCIIGLYNFIVLRKIKLINMLNAYKQVEFQFKRSGKVYSFIFGLSIILYIVCGACTVKLINSEVDYSAQSMMYIGISLITFILATYGLFYSIAYIIIYIKNRWINFKYGGVTDEEINNYIKEHSTLNINSETLKISEKSNYKESIGVGFYSPYSNSIMILPDEVCDKLDFLEANFIVNINNEMSYEYANEFQNSYINDWFRKKNPEFVKKYSNESDITYEVIDTRIKSIETNNILIVTLAMRILGIYLGVVFLMISLTILSLSQLSESIEHKDRFNVLKRLGIEDKEISKIILKQISIYFIVPISIAMIGVAIFIYNYYLFYKDIIIVFIGDGTFVLSIIFGVTLMLVVYICYFVGTYYTFKRNINL